MTFLLLHYFGGSHREWDEVVKRLSPTFRTIAADLPGFGEARGADGPVRAGPGRPHTNAARLPGSRAGGARGAQHAGQGCHGGGRGPTTKPAGCGVAGAVAAGWRAHDRQAARGANRGQHHAGARGSVHRPRLLRQPVATSSTSRPWKTFLRAVTRRFTTGRCTAAVRCGQIASRTQGQDDSDRGRGRQGHCPGRADGGRPCRWWKQAEAACTCCRTRPT